MDLFKDIIGSLNSKTDHVFENNQESEKEYAPYIVNKSFGNIIDTILYANEMNLRSELSNRQQYDFYYFGIPKAKRFAKWIKKENTEDIEAVKEYYSVSDRVAKQYLLVLSNNDLLNIKRKLFKGSVGKGK